MKRLVKSLWLVLILAFVVCAPTVLFGQAYPAKEINMTVAIATGGTVDISARLLAKAAEKYLGKPIVVTNNGGGSGSVALELLKNSAADGYHIVACPQTPLVEVPILRKVGYTVDDFVPIMHYAEPDSGVVVRVDSPFKTLKDLVEYARKNPGKVTFSTSGATTPFALAMMHIARKEGISWTAVPVPGGDPNMPLLGGHVTAFAAATSWKRYVDEGRFRLLAVFSERRMKEFPEVPTIKELGYDFVARAYYLFVAPKGTPTAIIQKLDETFRRAMEDAEFKGYMNKMALRISYGSSETTRKRLVESLREFKKTLEELKIPREE